ncbi:hypothetical protein PJF56_07340 [Roseofilum sp. BLCC_M91]|uniref:Pyruvate carboxyltransferase domain-containing protein n=1 Tax=Roseofilum halophilum BLCC-M91 TaxID=3022259 RepID=A0ABT7BJI5_9CYAN|nr:hypothetical protein [Roseofilum halophilum]MDJ1178671.1 hypothetical protein [Roseofilum halophilum BLCC-M91]
MLDTILDVTLRDGGYLNRWQFSWENANHLLSFLHQQGLRNVEVGFVRSPQLQTTAVNGCPPEFLAKLRQFHPDMNLVCMLNPADGDWQAAVADKLEHISLLRMPCTAELIDHALEIAHAIKQQCKDIRISLNLICVSSYSLEEIKGLLSRIAVSRDVDIVYLADSRGALYPSDVQTLISSAREICPQALGFHAHDTQGYAIRNSDRAVAYGCEWIDVTLNSFGLAGGNTSLEGYLTHHQLQPEGIDLEAAVREFCQDHLPLTHPPLAVQQLYRKLAEKNIDPVWSKQLEEKYTNNLHDLVSRVSRQDYKTLESVLGAIDTLRSPVLR